ncbi:hypothetical protein ACYJW8_08040 [Frateuria aurantia]
MAAAQTPHSQRRRRQLQAMGIQPWRLRAQPQLAGASPQAADPEAGVGCVVVVPASCETRIRDLLMRALRSGGPELARVGCVTGGGGVLPSAGCYLLLDAGLEAEVLAHRPQAQRHVLASPSRLLTAAGKRELWQSLREIRRQLATGVAA